MLDKLLFSDNAPKAMKKSLDLMSTRQSVITSNIGNLDTPGFKASEKLCKKPNDSLCPNHVDSDAGKSKKVLAKIAGITPAILTLKGR